MVSKALFIPSVFSKRIKNKQKLKKKMKPIHKLLLFLLIAGNIFGAIFGFTWWYGSQLLNSPWYLWLIVAPCPLYAALFVVCISIILLKFHLKNFFIQLLLFLSGVGMIKYGIWTVFFWLSYPSARVTLPMYMIAWLVGGHAVMVLESALIIPKINIKKYGAIFLIISLAWFFLNDFVLYFRNEITSKIEIPHLNLVFYAALFLTAISPFAVLAANKFLKKKDLIKDL